jgi:Protein of unknown function (DUF1592)/Protein of unknown function (DUF1588)/Protein of unknown function (DUF1595)/Protein of unknown function (DUF1587)/Protein of unknown function (DUF1585)
MQAQAVRLRAMRVLDPMRLISSAAFGQKIALLASLVTGACTGAVGASSARNSGGNTAGQSPSGGSGAQPGEGGSGGETCGGATPELRRLSHGEYNNAVRDLLGDATRPAKGFPSDTAANGIGETRNVSSLLFEGYESTALTLVQAAWTRDQDRIAKKQTPFLRTCDLAQTGCPRAIIARFARLAWRRPVLDPEIDALLKMLDVARGLGDAPEVGIRAALQAVLLAPDFIFRHERLVSNGEVSDGFAPVDAYAVASKLASFLWSSTPDERLLDSADAGRLNDASSIEEEVLRMLADRKSDGLVESFVASWLETFRLDKTNLDKALFPTWSDAIKTALKAETIAFVGTFLREQSSALDMLDAGFTFANETSAPLYGVTGVQGADLQRVEVDRVRRGGLLTHAGLLAMTSLATRTSPARRGRWVLERFLCIHPPPPPPDAVTNPPPAVPGQTLRQRLEAHRDKPACQGCHDLMDPIGFGLEAYDATGTWRTTDNGVPVDSAGSLPNTDVVFTGGHDLGRAIKENAAEAFSGCLTRNLLAHAIGRPLGDADESTVSRIGVAFSDRSVALGELVLAVTASKHFTHRCVGGQTTAAK